MNNSLPDGWTDEDIDAYGYPLSHQEEAPEWKPRAYPWLSSKSQSEPTMMDLMADVKRLSDEILEDEKQCNFKK
tara:strand:- start:1674 stop:1895 length:222 start_codon:yes stop_codon:yes gene_type:complete